MVNIGRVASMSISVSVIVFLTEDEGEAGGVADAENDIEVETYSGHALNNNMVKA